MIGVPEAMIAGVVLPEGVLTSPWFSAFTLFVAFNTIIYLGLTLAKFVPWPSPVHPSQVRAALTHSPDEEDTPMPRRLPGRRPPGGDLVQRLRGAASVQTIPLALSLVGALTVVVGLLNTVLYLDAIGPLVLIGVAFGVVLVIVAQVLARAAVSPRVMMWSWTLLLVGLVAETAWRASVLDSAVLLAYAAIALTVMAPISLSWSTGITGAVLGIIPIVIAGAEVSSVDTVSWAIAALTAALASLVLLQLRLAGITSLATQQLRAQTLASTDSLTGVFSRTGILALAPAVAQTAESAGTDVGVVVCTVADLDTINADYGFEYGGQVLGATARALRACVPGGTLVGRWGGRTFIALVGGDAPAADSLRDSIDQAILRSGVALGKRPVSVDVGCASGSPGDVTLEELVARATANASA